MVSVPMANAAFAALDAHFRGSGHVDNQASISSSVGMEGWNNFLFREASFEIKKAFRTLAESADGEHVVTEMQKVLSVLSTIDTSLCCVQSVKRFCQITNAISIARILPATNGKCT